MLAEKTFDTGELTITYHEGPASGPPMVLLHGLTLNVQSIQSVIEHFTPDWHVYACDLRGHGKSGRVADSYRVADYIPDTVAFLRSVVTEPAVVVGHSLGGLIAPGVAALAPELVRALVLLDPALYPRNTKMADDPVGNEWFYWVYDTIKSPRSNVEMVERWRSRAPGFSETRLQRFADWMYELDPDTVRTALEDRLFEEYDLEGVLRRVQAPTLILYAGKREDSAVRDEDIELVKNALPQGVLVSVPDAGHMVQDEQTDFVVDQMRAFLAGN